MILSVSDRERLDQFLKVSPLLVTDFSDET